MILTRVRSSIKSRATLWQFQARAGNVGDTSKSKLDFERIQPKKQLGLFMQQCIRLCMRRFVWFPEWGMWVLVNQLKKRKQHHGLTLRHTTLTSVHVPCRSTIHPSSISCFLFFFLFLISLITFCHVLRGGDVGQRRAITLQHHGKNCGWDDQEEGAQTQWPWWGF